MQIPQWMQDELRLSKLSWFFANAITSTPSTTPGQPLQLSSVTASVETDAEPGAALPTREDTRGVAMQVGGWLLDKALAFIRVAWWLLPLPIVFSCWRQFRTVPVCAHCASRNLMPATGEA